MVFDYHDCQLKQPDQQIRLLHLQLGNDDDADIQVRLQAYELNGCPPYTAISYTWGEEKPTVAITVNGQTFRVRMNCWYALWQMRHHGQHCILWMDCVSINQTSIAEKNAQVAKMGEIFRNANMTAICLGPGQSLAAARRFVESMRDRSASQVDRDSVRELQYKSYFRRIWIKQEIILSRQVNFFCGVDSLDWDAFENVTSAVTDYVSKSSKSSLTWHPKSKAVANSVHTSLIESRRQYRLSSHKSGSTSHPWAELWQLLATYGDGECEDPHDKVYALIPLIPDNLRSQLRLSIDYRMPLLHLCLELVDNYILELSTLTQPGQPPNRVADSTWTTLIRAIQHWFCPILSDPDVLRFAARWSTIESPQKSSNVVPLSLRDQPIRSPKYCSMLVLYRFVMTGHSNNNADPVSGASDFVNTVFSRGDGFVNHDTAFISQALLVNDIQQWFTSTSWDRGPEDIAGFLADSGRKSHLSALPSDLRVKVVRCSGVTIGFPDVYLVPAHCEIGDELLYCRFGDPYSSRAMLPIVRTYDQLAFCQTDAPGELRYTILIGWALKLCFDGSLHTEPLYSQWMDTTPWKTRTLHVYYEDFILYAMLLRDLPAYLGHPCTHQEHPSFMVEDLVITENNAADLPRWARPVNFSVQQQLEAQEKQTEAKQTTGKKKVSFA